MRVVVGSQVLVEDPPKALVKAAKKVRIRNPQRAQALRFGSIYAAGKHPAYVKACEFLDDGSVVIPRAVYFRHFHEQILGSPEFESYTVTTDVEFPEIKLEPYAHQEAAASDFMDYVNECDEKGVPVDTTIILATSAGKTILGMYLASLCQERALIVVHSKEIEKAWMKDCPKAFGIPNKKIGRIRGKRITIGEHFTVGSVQTLMNLDPKLWQNEFGIIIFDEVHKHAAAKFANVARRGRANVRVGISGSDKRKDGRMPCIRWHLGEDCHHDKTPRNSVPLIFHGVKTNRAVPPTREDQDGNPEYDYADVCTRLGADTQRDERIIALVQHIIENYRGDILISVNRVDHANDLAVALIQEGISAIALTGQITGKAREDIYEEICRSEYRVTVGMLAIVSTGANNPFWHHVISAAPFSDPTTAEQLKGRPIRKQPNKEFGHYWDLCDECSMLRNMHTTRYRALKPHIVSAEWHEIMDNSGHLTIKEIKRARP